MTKSKEETTIGDGLEIIRRDPGPSTAGVNDGYVQDHTGQWWRIVPTGTAVGTGERSGLIRGGRIYVR